MKCKSGLAAALHKKIPLKLGRPKTSLDVYSSMAQETYVLYPELSDDDIVHAAVDVLPCVGLVVSEKKQFFFKYATLKRLLLV